MISKPIIFIGFMGAGKTTVARELARQLSCEAIDLDEEIGKREQRTPGAIIELEGETRFRELETQVLREVLIQSEARVIALGGGAWTIAMNQTLIRKHEAVVIWLDADFDLCWKRIEASNETRPLARSRTHAHELFAERRKIYETADARVEIGENDTEEEIATRVVQFLT